MTPGAMTGAVTQLFGIAYAWLNNNLISPLISLGRGFEIAFIFLVSLVFFFVSLFVLMKQAKRLPKSYMIKITDVYGKETALDGLRQVFSTHEAAESFAKMYQDNFGSHIGYKVVGIKDKITDIPKSKN
jgi:hypothetical protein